MSWYKTSKKDNSFLKVAGENERIVEKQIIQLVKGREIEKIFDDFLKSCEEGPASFSMGEVIDKITNELFSKTDADKLLAPYDQVEMKEEFGRRAMPMILDVLSAEKFFTNMSDVGIMSLNSSDPSVSWYKKAQVTKICR